MIISRFLKISLLILLAGLSFAQNVKKYPKVERVTEVINEVSNDSIRIITFDPSGRFSIVTKNYKSILFYDKLREETFTSHFNLKIDDSLYSNEPRLALLANTPKLTGKSKKTITGMEYTYQIPSKNIEFLQKLTMVKYGSYYGVLIECFIKNKDTIAHSAGLLHEFDTEINKNDASILYTNFGAVSRETLFTKDKMPVYWQASESDRIDSGFIGQGNLKGTYPFINDADYPLKTTLTPPDYLYMADWEKCSSILWDIDPLAGDKYYDSGLLLKWNQNTVQPNATLYFATYIGIGKPASNSFLSASILVPEIKFIDKKYQPNPFKIEIMVQNMTEKRITNIRPGITLPELLKIDSTSIAPLPQNLEPYEAGFINYSLNAQLTPRDTSLPVQFDIFSNGNNSIKTGCIVTIPAAPGIDIYKPVIEITQKSCNILGTIRDNNIYDSGIDSILIDTSDNFSFWLDKNKKGARVVDFSASLIDKEKFGYAKIRVFDMAGNSEIKEFNMIPRFAGFDTLMNFIPGKEIYVPFKIMNFPEPFPETGFKIKIKYDKKFLVPANFPYSLENSQSKGLDVRDFSVTDSSISIRFYSDCILNNGTILYFIFKVQDKPPDSSWLEALEFDLSYDKVCISRSNSILTRFYTDSILPNAIIKQQGNKLLCTITDDGIYSAGIYSVSLFYSENAILKYDRFDPGAKKIEAAISLVDTTIPMNGILKIIDGSGNMLYKYFLISPLFVSLDTIKARNNDIIYITPKIHSLYPDTAIRSFEFSLSYDTSSLKLVSPYFETQNTGSASFSITIDTSEKGTIKVNGTGGVPLKSDSLIRLKFQVKPGEDKLSQLVIDYIKINNGDRLVTSTNSVFIRINSDKIPPQIKCEQRKNRLYITISEKRDYDIGINTIVFQNITNFPSNISPEYSYGNIIKYYEFKMLDSTKPAHISVIATDLLGNKSDTSFKIIPIQIKLPAGLRGREFDTLNIPIRLYNYEISSINKIKFNVDFDDRIITPLGLPYNTSGTLSENAVILLKQKSNSLGFDISFTALPPAGNDILLKVNFKVLSGLPAISTIIISNIAVNNDSLCSYGSESELKRYFHDTLPPVINAYQMGCYWKASITDIRNNDSKLVEIKLDSNINFKDTLSFTEPFQRLDSTATVNIYPLDPRYPSSAILYTKDYENNITRVKIEIKPLELRLPEKVSLFPEASTKIPVYLNGFTDQNITGMKIRIEYDHSLIKIDSISTDSAISAGSKYEFALEGTNYIKFDILPNNIPNTNRLVSLCITALKGTRKISPLGFKTYSANNDTLCLTKSDGLIERRGIDSIIVSIDSTLKGKYSSNISIPVNIKAENISTKLNGYIITIKYNGSLLNPLSVNTGGTASENCSVNILNKESAGSLTFEAKGNVDPKKSNILCRLSAKVLVGNANSTLLNITSLGFYYDTASVTDKLYITHFDGLFTLDSLQEWQKGLLYKGNILLQNSPNPFNSSTKISYHLQEKSLVQIKIYDILGRIIFEPVNEIKDEGMHDFYFNAGNLTTGVYFYKIETGHFSQIKKMMLLK